MLYDGSGQLTWIQMVDRSDGWTFASRQLQHDVGRVGPRSRPGRPSLSRRAAHRNTLAAMTGASAKELMVRMGHSSARAALGYQHETEERERLIAVRLSDMIDGAQRRSLNHAGDRRCTC